MLPTGVVFALKVPDAQELIVKKLIPANLRSIALKFQAKAVDVESMDTEELAQMLTFLRMMVAHGLRYIWTGDPAERDPETHDFAWSKYLANDPRWEAVTLTQADLAEGTIDGDDYAALQGIVTREFGISEITALSLRERGLINEDEFERRKAGVESTRALESFRGEQRRADPGAAGATMGRDSGKPDRHRRSRSRVPAE